MDIVINACFGGYSLSKEALLEIYERNPDSQAIEVVTPLVAAKDPSFYKMFFAEAEDGNFVGTKSSSSIDVRSCSTLVSVVRELGERAADSVARLKIFNAGDFSDLRIVSNDGVERVVVA
jgi:hypothetical protein